MLCMLWCRCLTSRELLKHHQKCTASDCPVCTPVKQYVQKQRMAMQKQQQESLRLREAERHRLHGDSRMQVWHLKIGFSDKHLWQPRTRTPWLLPPLQAVHACPPFSDVRVLPS